MHKKKKRPSSKKHVKDVLSTEKKDPNTFTLWRKKITNHLVSLRKVCVQGVCAIQDVFTTVKNRVRHRHHSNAAHRVIHGLFSVATVYVVVAMILGAYAGGRWHEAHLRSTTLMRAAEKEEAIEQQHMRDIAAIQDRIDTSTWKTYHSAWYGFAMMHPADWRVRQIYKTNEKSKAIYRMGFFTPEQSDDGEGHMQDRRGFEVAVYDLRDTPQIMNTDEYPRLRTGADRAACHDIAGRLYETGDYPAEEFYVGPDDPCYEPTLFFMLVDGRYIYTIVPVITGTDEDDVTQEDLMVAVTNRVPEYFSAVSQFRNTDIVRPKPKPVAPPVIDAPHPAWYKVDALGRKVCAKKNDKPRKSKKNKKKHMDMECCLDPDEYPNPHCYYDLEKYGKYF